jgi:hypothetical protein
METCHAILAPLVRFWRKADAQTRRFLHEMCNIRPPQAPVIDVGSKSISQFQRYLRCNVGFFLYETRDRHAE